MANTSEIRNGLCIELNNDIWSVVEFQHVKPGKGAAFVRTKLKSLSHGRVVDHTFSAGHKIFPVRVERRNYQYLYKDEFGFNFMNMETFEQVMLEEKMLERPGLLKEEMKIEILFHSEKEIPFHEIDNSNTIGISSGASAPEKLVQALLNNLKKDRKVSIEEVIVAEEKVVFKLPKELN